MKKCNDFFSQNLELQIDAEYIDLNNTPSWFLL